MNLKQAKELKTEVAEFYNMANTEIYESKNNFRVKIVFRHNFLTLPMLSAITSLAIKYNVQLIVKPQTIDRLEARFIENDGF